MRKKPTRRDIINYIYKTVDKGEMNVIYNDNNIQYHKCELYSDFVQSLLHLIFNTYLGDEVTSEENQRNHFKWCWKRNQTNFAKEDIYIDSEKLYEYLQEPLLA